MLNKDTVVGITYLFDKYVDLICSKRKINWKQFCELDEKYKILRYIENNREVFDEYSYTDGLDIIEKYILDDSNKLFTC